MFLKGRLSANIGCLLSSLFLREVEPSGKPAVFPLFPASVSSTLFSTPAMALMACSFVTSAGTVPTVALSRSTSSSYSIDYSTSSMLLPARAAFAYALVGHLAEISNLPCEIFCTSSGSFSVSGVHRQGTPVRVLEEGRYLAKRTSKKSKEKLPPTSLLRLLDGIGV